MLSSTRRPRLRAVRHPRQAPGRRVIAGRKPLPPRPAPVKPAPAPQPSVARVAAAAAVPVAPPPAPAPKAPCVLQRPFNSDPDCPPYVLGLLRRFGITHALETGTYQGGTTRWLAQMVKTVHTIENNPDLVRENEARFRGLANVQAHAGNSPTVMAAVLAHATDQDRYFFYLDAHWNDYWPIRDELLEIAKSRCRNNCLIVIDDFQVPDRPDIPFDSYHGQPLNVAFVEAALRQALPDLAYTYYVPSAAHVKSRGRLVAYPRSWEVQSVEQR